MYKAYKYRLYPNKQQKKLLDKHFGSIRFIYNLALETKHSAYVSGVNYTCFDLHKQLTELKKDLIWLKEINSQSLQQSITNLDTAYKNFFKNGSGFPKYKSKHKKQSFQVKQNIKIDFDNNKFFIPKFKEGIKCVYSRRFNGEIKQATVSKNKTGKYFVSILIDTKRIIPTKNEITNENTIGIDLGIKDFCIISNGDKIENNHFLKKSLDRIKVLQKRASKKQKGSNNRKKYNKKIAKEYEKLTNRRNDFYHKLSTKIVSENQGAIIVEDLNIKDMSSRCKPKQDDNGKYTPNGQSAKSGLNKSLSDVSWGIFLNMLEYKCEWNGRTLHKIGRFEPSTKTCSECGHINHNLTLKDRKWTCHNCNTTHDRDINAAINIKKMGLISLIKNSGSERPVVPVEMSTLVESMKQESHQL